MYATPKTSLEKAHQHLIAVADYLLYTRGCDERELPSIEFTRRDIVLALGHSDVKHVHENGAAAAKLAALRSFGLVAGAASAPKQLRDPLRLTELAIRIITRAPEALAEALRVPPLFTVVLMRAERTLPGVVEGGAPALPMRVLLPVLEEMAACGDLPQGQVMEAADVITASWNFAYAQKRKRTIESLHGDDEGAFRYALGGGGTVYIRFNAPLKQLKQLERFEAAMKLLTESLRDDLE